MPFRPTAIVALLPLVLAAASVAGCTPDRIEASGYSASENRDVGDIGAVELKAPAEVTVVQGEGSSVRVTADRNALPYVSTRVIDGVLTISVEQGGRPIPVEKNVKIAVEVRAPRLLAVKNTSRGSIRSERIDADAFQIGNYGAGTVTIDRLRAVRLAVDVGGAGDVRMGTGMAGAQQITVSGAGSYLAPDLESQVAVVTINGSGDAEIWATEALDGAVSGTGSVKYWGDPELSAEAAGSNKMESLGWKASE